MDAIDMNSTEQLLKLNETLKTHSINLPVLIFVACVEYEECNLTEVSDKLLMSTASMTTIRDIAFKKSFVKESDSRDRRKKFYQITDLGKEMLASCRQ